MTKQPNKKERRAAALLKHYATCERVAKACGRVKSVDGEKISNALRALEKEAHDSATAQCNGASYNGQPYRPYAEEEYSEPSPWDLYELSVIARLVNILHGGLPPGFRINQDARGYALKVDPDLPGGKAFITKTRMHTDWGGNGILSPEIEVD